MNSYRDYYVVQPHQLYKLYKIERKDVNIKVEIEFNREDSGAVQCWGSGPNYPRSLQLLAMVSRLRRGRVCVQNYWSLCVILNLLLFEILFVVARQKSEMSSDYFYLRDEESN